MRIVIQRVLNASVSINNEVHSAISKGFLLLVGVTQTDTQEDVEWLANKVCSLRIFDDEEGVMNKSIQDIDGEILAVSQFTLMASYKKGTDLHTCELQVPTILSHSTTALWIN